MLIQSFEMDTKRAAHKEGFLAGIAQGFSDGVRQNKLDTAKIMKLSNCNTDFIVQMTGLSTEEIEKL